jgi:putative serine protease PepD
MQFLAGAMRHHAGLLLSGLTIAATLSSQALFAASSAERVYESAAKSVFTIVVEGDDFIGTGSGVAISRDQIVTNWHVVEAATSRQEARITVLDSNGRQLGATIKSRNANHDLAILTTDARNLVPATLSTAQKPAVGSAVFAIGSPRGLRASITGGIVR